jgi:hypothetical protein
LSLGLEIKANLHLSVTSVLLELCRMGLSVCTDVICGSSLPAQHSSF